MYFLYIVHCIIVLTSIAGHGSYCVTYSEYTPLNNCEIYPLSLGHLHIVHVIIQGWVMVGAYLHT